MKQLNFDIYSETLSVAVVGRSGEYRPALLIPGEDLHKLWASFETILNMAQQGDCAVFAKEVEGSAELMGALFGYYCGTLAEHQLMPPFRCP